MFAETERKKKRIDEIKGSVVEGSKQLELVSHITHLICICHSTDWDVDICVVVMLWQAVRMMEGVPSEEILTWMEDVTGNMQGNRLTS